MILRRLIYRGFKAERQKTQQQRYHDLDSLALFNEQRGLPSAASSLGNCSPTLRLVRAERKTVQIGAFYLDAAHPNSSLMRCTLTVLLSD